MDVLVNIQEARGSHLLVLHVNHAFGICIAKVGVMGRTVVNLHRKHKFHLQKSHTDKDFQHPCSQCSH